MGACVCSDFLRGKLELVAAVEVVVLMVMTLLVHDTACRQAAVGVEMLVGLMLHLPRQLQQG